MRRSGFHRAPFGRHRRPVLRWVVLAVALCAVLMLAYGCAAQQLLYSARGTMIFLPEMPVQG